MYGRLPRLERSRRTSFTTWWTAFVAVAMLTGGGCSRKFYRTRADQDVAEIYAEKRCEEAYTLPPLPGIEVDPRSRFFDPSPPDCPALPIPEPGLYQYPLPDLQTGNPHERPASHEEILGEDRAVAPETIPAPEWAEPDGDRTPGKGPGPEMKLDPDQGRLPEEGLLPAPQPGQSDPELLESPLELDVSHPVAPMPSSRPAPLETLELQPPISSGNHSTPHKTAPGIDQSPSQRREIVTVAASVPGQQASADAPPAIVTTAQMTSDTTANALKSPAVVEAPRQGSQNEEQWREVASKRVQIRLAELIREQGDRVTETVPTGEGDVQPPFEAATGVAEDPQEETEDDEFRIVPIPSDYWKQLPETCVPRMLEFQSVQNEFRRSFPQATGAEMLGMLSDAPRLTLPMVTELATLNSRELQTQKERLYRAALVLTGERYEYLLRPTSRGNGSSVFYTHERIGGITENGLRVPTRTAVTKTTATAGQFLASFANDVVLTFNGAQGFAANVGSTLLFDFQQTVFQRDVVFESLTQSERDVVYAARDLIRFQRGLFVELASRYYGLLREYRSIEISSQDYFSNLRAFLQGRAEYLQAGRIPRFQVDQFEQNALQSRSELLLDCNSLESSLDRLKLIIGLPPEMPLNLDLSELESLTSSDELTVTRQLVFRARQTLQDAAIVRPKDREAAINSASVLTKRLTGSLRLRRELEGSERVDGAGQETNQLALRLALLDARLQVDKLMLVRDQQVNPDLPAQPLKQFNRTTGLIEARILLSQRAAELRAAMGAPLDVETMERLGQFEKRLNGLNDAWEAAEKKLDFPAMDDLVDSSAKLFAETEDLVRAFIGELLPEDDSGFEESIRQAVADTITLVDRVESSAVEGLDEVDVQDDEAMLLALVQRLDLMNVRGELADARRQIKLAADDLRAILDLRATQVINTRSGVNRPFDFTFDDSQTRLSLALDTPLNRRFERNAYRASLINYNAARRALITEEDEIKLDVREDLRQLRLRRNRYEISVASAALAYERVVSTRLQLQLAVGGVVARDFLEAQQAYTQALNNVATDHIAFILGRIDLFFDTESMLLDENGYWSGGQDDSLELPPIPDFYDANPNPYGRLPDCLRYSEEVRRNH